MRRQSAFVQAARALLSVAHRAPRSLRISFVVLDSQGIIYTLSLPTTRKAEPKTKIVRDILRFYLWIVTKHTETSFNKNQKILSAILLTMIHR